MKSPELCAQLLRRGPRASWDPDHISVLLPATGPGCTLGPEAGSLEAWLHSRGPVLLPGCTSPPQGNLRARSAHPQMRTHGVHPALGSSDLLLARVLSPEETQRESNRSGLARWRAGGGRQGEEERREASNLTPRARGSSWQTPRNSEGSAGHMREPTAVAPAQAHTRCPPHTPAPLPASQNRTRAHRIQVPCHQPQGVATGSAGC